MAAGAEEWQQFWHPPRYWLFFFFFKIPTVLSPRQLGFQLCGSFIQTFWQVCPDKRGTSNVKGYWLTWTSTNPVSIFNSITSSSQVSLCFLVGLKRRNWHGIKIKKICAILREVYTLKMHIKQHTCLKKKKTSPAPLFTKQINSKMTSKKISGAEGLIKVNKLPT